MKFFLNKPWLTGVACPLSSLRSLKSSGIGEYPDLIILAQFCQKAGLDVIQLLPINDTGFESSPYSALSAYALHPIYIRLEDLPGAAALASQIAALKNPANHLERINHISILTRKWPIFKQLFQQDYENSGTKKEIDLWIKNTSWGKTYCVYSTLKHRFSLKSWQQWPEYQEINEKEIAQLWKDLGSEAAFFAWLQIHAEKQLQNATAQCQALGVALKGDIPILLNEDSADVWAHRKYFDLDWKAGAPPDAMNPSGQNWGFPSYKWDELEKDDYSWWKQRLLHANKFFHAYRIDHVLGFFRLWITPNNNMSAQLGRYEPIKKITKSQLNGLGFDEARIVWLSEPHIFGLELRERMGEEAVEVIKQALQQVGDEDLFKFQKNISGEKNILALRLSEKAKDCLISWFHNRALINLGAGEFVTSSTYYATRAYESLGSEERWNFEHLIADNQDLSMQMWEERGRKLLSFMTKTTEMLVCAEDLGNIPSCVPKVLEEQGILGLKILRWSRNWNEPGQPYFKVSQYPYQSVCTLSVHDTTTLRQWWAEETDRSGIFKALGLNLQTNVELDSESSETLLRGFMSATSRLCILALSDWFLLQPSYLYSDPNLERINVPGTVEGDNWTYRMKPFLEDLEKSEVFQQKIKNIVSIRTDKINTK